MSMPTEDPPIGHLVSDALRQLRALLHSEVDLAKAELSMKATKAALALALLAGGAVFGLATTIMLLFTVAALLADAGMYTGLATLVATILGALVAAALAWVGLQKLQSGTLVPKRTIRQLRRDAAAAKGRV